MSTLRSVVLCGGSGTRLWPLSRSLYPKQFMELGGHTLFGDTVDRAAALPDSGAPLVVCNEEHRFYVAAALQQQGLKGAILLEPKGRNTAPAIALAAFPAGMIRFCWSCLPIMSSSRRPRSPRPWPAPAPARKPGAS